MIGGATHKLATGHASFGSTFPEAPSLSTAPLSEVPPGPYKQQRRQRGCILLGMTSSMSRKDGAPTISAIAYCSLLALLSALLFRPALAQPALQHKYVICVGTESEKLTSGTLWLYSYSWYGLQKFKLTGIQNGLAVVPLDVSQLKREMDPHPNTDAYVVVVQTGEHMWYRTFDIPQDRFWTDFRGAINSLGTISTLPTSETQLILPSPTKRHITLLYSDGRPKAGMDLTVSEFLWNQNHCAVHEGLPLGSFRTDEKGTIEVLAPLVPLYLDVEYFHNVGTGPAGIAYSANSGMKIGPEERVVAKEEWELPRITVELRIVTASGQPRPDVDVGGNWSTNTCGGGDRLARTDAEGIARLDLNATFGALGLMIGGPYSAGDPEGDRKTRPLTDAELRELFSKRKMTIRWDPTPKPVSPMLERPLGYWTSVPVNCQNVSGRWADPENRGTWNLNQIGESITGSLTISKGNCGSIRWQVAGRMDGGVANLTATSPEPTVDQCGGAATATITEARVPYCKTMGAQ
jgi:hypothetical protein